MPAHHRIISILINRRYFTGLDLEQRVFRACCDLTKLQPANYQILEQLIDFAAKSGDDEQKIAKLIEHPDRSVGLADIDHIGLLRRNKQRMFSAPMPGEVGTARCHPQGVRENLLLAAKTKKVIESE